MAEENTGVFALKLQELHEILHGWYMSSWECKGLNNDEIYEEFSSLLNDVEEAECTCDDCKVGIIEKNIALLASRKKITESQEQQLKFSLAMAINSLSHFSEASNYCPCCGPVHAMEDLIDSYYWLGVLIGSEREREDFGVSKAARNASDARHTFNRDRRLNVQDWYRKNRKSFKNKDDAASDAEHVFNLSFSCIRKYLRNV
jgi:hypothetical protein